MSNFFVRAAARWLPLIRFRGSQQYWRDRYRLGGDSGMGSAGSAATYKADVLNSFISAHKVGEVIEFGCGDGRQLALASYPSYLGIDVSIDAVRQCRKRFQHDLSKKFMMAEDFQGGRADLAISMDVIFHLIEDSIYDDYLRCLFASAVRFVAIYSSNQAVDYRTLRHVRHRSVSSDIAVRFPEFVRMQEWESRLAPPVERSDGVPTQFLFYRRLTRTDGPVAREASGGL